MDFVNFFIQLRDLLLIQQSHPHSVPQSLTKIWFMSPPSGHVISWILYMIFVSELFLLLYCFQASPVLFHVLALHFMAEQHSIFAKKVIAILLIVFLTVENTDCNINYLCL